jgi:hypothetical protein
MNQPRESQQSEVDSLSRQIDRLVDDELPDRERSALLVRLEAEPDGWRRCALAFLEAQSWRETLVSLPITEAAQPVARVVQRPQLPQRWRYAARLTCLAASLTMTFILGWTLRGSPASIAGGKHLSAQADNDRPTPSGESQPSELTQHVQPAALSFPLAEQPDGLAPVIKEWEQRGYQAETQMRLASLKMKDGRHVEIPVHEVRLRYVRDRTY